MVKRILGKIKTFALNHKIISATIIVVLAGICFFAYKSLTNTSEQTRYVLADVSAGTIISAVSGTGQVSASNQINLTPGTGASGKVVYLNAVSGQKVTAGTLLLELDTTDAEKAIRDAESNLQSAQISLQKLVGPDGLPIPLNKQNAEDALNQAYQSAYNTVSSIFTDLPTVMTDLQSEVYGTTFTNNQANIDFYTGTAYTYDENASLYKDSLVKSYQKALDEYTQNFNDYKLTTIYSDNATIDAIISQTYNTAKDIAQAVKDTNNLIQFYKNTLAQYNIKSSTLADAQLATVNSDASKVNSDISSLLNTQSALKSDKTALANADLDVTSQQLSFAKSQSALDDAKAALSNYYIYAPFDGVVGTVSVKKGDTISSGTSAITFITRQQMTQISLSEVDITKVKLGDKVMLSFDAIDGLSISGKVTEIDTIGAVSQGVVSYNVQITFDTQDDRIKPGMSVSANIITDTKQNVLVVPNSAVKSSGGNYYVLVLGQKYNLAGSTASAGIVSVPAPLQKPVQIGLADDTNTEITGGLAEGDQIVVRTISGASTTAATSATPAAGTRVGGGQSFFIGGGGAGGR